MAQRQHIGGVARQVVSLFAGHRLLIFRVILSEAAAQIVHQRQVEAVEPDHRLIAGIAVIVPAPLRRQNKVAGAHGGAFAIDGGKCPFTFNHKAQRRLVMTVARRHFAGHDQL